MYFNAAYDDMGTIPIELLESAASTVTQVSDKDYSYRDYNVTDIKESWLRIDFTKPPEQINLIGMYNAFKAIALFIINKHNLEPISSMSLSQLRPQQVLDEHIDGRLIHKLTNRYLIPLSASNKNYNYGYFANKKVMYPLVYGRFYRINNSIIHSALNLENTERYNILIDTMDARLKNKFKNHPDLYRSVNMLSANYKFEERLRIKTKLGLK